MRTRIAAVIVLLSALPLTAQDALEKGAAYFPLVPGSVYEYKGTFNGKEYNDTYVLKTQKVGELTVTYFDRESGSLIGTAMIGLGAFHSSKDALETLQASSVKSLDTLKPADAQVLLPAELKEGAETVVKGHGGEMLLKLTLKGREDITVPAGTFKNCLKFEMEQAWPKKDKTYMGTAWLAAGTGCVKRVNFTGRIDELVSVKIPGR